jgi:hypothetical protein
VTAASCLHAHPKPVPTLFFTNQKELSGRLLWSTTCAQVTDVPAVGISTLVMKLLWDAFATLVRRSQFVVSAFKLFSVSYVWIVVVWGCNNGVVLWADVTVKYADAVSISAYTFLIFSAVGIIVLRVQISPPQVVRRIFLLSVGLSCSSWPERHKLGFVELLICRFEFFFTCWRFCIWKLNKTPGSAAVLQSA